LTADGRDLSKGYTGYTPEERNNIKQAMAQVASNLELLAAEGNKRLGTTYSSPDDLAGAGILTSKEADLLKFIRADSMISFLGALSTAQGRSAPPNTASGIGRGGRDALSQESPGITAAYPVGRQGSPMEVPRGTNVPAVIDGMSYSGHALDQMQGRGLTPTIIKSVVQKGITYPTREGTVGYYDPVANVRVIKSEADGRVITVIPGGP
jgi:hypothetical protein